MTTFVDGYNLIFAAAKKMSGFDMHGKDAAPVRRTVSEVARDSLLDLLVKFRAARPGRIVVFFDGGLKAAHLPRHQMARGIDVAFSDAHSDADSEIKNAVSHADQPRNIRVVTSDAAIRNFVARYGATVTESRAFLQEIEDALKASSLPQDEPMEKYEGTPDGDMDYWLKIFGKKDEDS